MILSWMINKSVIILVHDKRILPVVLSFLGGNIVIFWSSIV